MHSVVCSMSISLDGYITDPDGRFDWSPPGPKTFATATDEVRGLSAHLLGRKLYETMAYWESIDPQWTAEEAEFGRLWRALPKIVFSSTLRKVVGASTLADTCLSQVIERLRAQPGEGDIAIGGPGLASDAADLGLIDEYRLRVYPILVGGGAPFFAHHGQRRDLRLVEQRTLDDQIVYLRYRVT